MAELDDQGQGDAATEAFEEVRAEVTLLRRAIERLAAERAEVPAPKDYDETLGRIAQAINKLAERMDVLADRPGIKITPEGIARQIATAGGTSRADDQRTIAEARDALERTTAQLAGVVASARRGDEQNRWLAWSAIGGVALGIVLWAVLGGAIARATPDSWRWPESMATRMLGGTTWEGARRLAAASYPDAWNAMVTGMVIGRGNEEALERCQRAANKAGEPMRCTVRIAPEKQR
ncbi:DUF6118 family protein [Sphingomonas paucimobilis]|jgi:hypothetical protein|uniref:DUF6118 family protein n=1 Tax=Sphingomonas paucimobilis TaxID=13689 RepID=UPI00203B9F67|nr:DUF6118 family protein [Sphingomonas paucimobilis]MCM3681755.1 DUF6118 family protein [Sphingomonas paucimobilis]